MSTNTSLYKILLKTAAAGLALQREDGSTPPGHNGPHNHPEQPIRNTGHWLITWCFAHRQTGDVRFHTAALKAATYLVDAAHRPGGFTVHHRDAPGKDQCNGLMGPAFTLEALVAGGVHLNRDDLLDLAASLLQMHPFNARAGLWHVREVDGTLHGVDVTLNHQIWFAATAAMVVAATACRGRDDIQQFLTALPRLMELRSNGRIVHHARDLSRRGQLRRLLSMRSGKAESEATLQEKKRETAYHVFNLYPLAMLSQQMPEAAFWQSGVLTTATQFADSQLYQSAIAEPNFLKPHIPAGFPLSFAERAYVDQTLGRNDLKYQQRMMIEQLALNYDWSTDLMTLRSADPTTQAARIYEMTRLQDIAFDLPTMEDGLHQAM